MTLVTSTAASGRGARQEDEPCILQSEDDAPQPDVEPSRWPQSIRRSWSPRRNVLVETQEPATEGGLPWPI
jgi:hypothetical protein